MNEGGGIIWVASYPKSGNTWVRFLIGNLIFGPQNSASSLNQFCPDLHEMAVLPPLPPQLVFMKTHLLYGAGLPGVGQTRGAIYVVRDPADVLLSNFHYGRRSAGDAGIELSAYVERFIETHGDPRWKSAGMGGWDENVQSWETAASSAPLLLLRYEEMRADATTAANRLCRYLGISRSEAQVAAAVSGSSFERMSAIERADIAAQRTGIFYKPYLEQAIAAGHRFMRQGRTGEARDVLTPPQRRRLYESLAPTAARLGYGGVGNASEGQVSA